MVNISSNQSFSCNWFMYFNLGKIKILKYLHDASIFIDPFEEEIFIANKRVTKKISVRLQTILQSKSMKPLKASREALNRECCQSCYQKFVKLRAKSLLAITLCCRRFELRILKIWSRSSAWVVVHLDIENPG